MPVRAARAQLEAVIFPFWLEHGIDHVNGGFFTCFDNRGRNLLSTDKFTWSQGRFVWLLARAARLADQNLLDADPRELSRLAEAGAAFLVEHTLRPDGTCHFVVDRTGRPTAGPAGETHSVYADCFVAMGLAELSRQTGDPQWLEIAAPVLDTASASIGAGTADTPPYPVPPGHTAFGPRMILLNTLLEYARARQELGLLTDEDRAALGAARDVMLSHRLPNGTFREMIPDRPDETTLVSRHRVPGHAIEGLWVALEAGELLGRTGIPALLASIPALCESAWDDDHGGLFRYVDHDGAAEPRGTDAGSPYEALVRRTWSTKLWWVHTEAAYTTALAAQRYGDSAAQGWFDRIWAYTLDTFPGGDEGSEWIQIRERSGKPLDEVVALPVKDPFHIARNLMQIVELGALTAHSYSAPAGT
ncbi:AGE family epimerase/isomerase [Phytoactinopolyspora mesophila]|uniref:N-acylglucosamine 2-epimerase n=1 Tax=Phytoactinopolyspora mesophila TaxID=2650750 RepID=A0A7K3M976_9ACTN|nr:AGE family epimerase/isomerase [Phytoactinopolyspora mesophila]NDL59865.1 N-acylglucosamine 2-epimerase [Phytoactinopolyspora mesophila]